LILAALMILAGVPFFMLAPASAAPARVGPTTGELPAAQVYD
jgi:hypothetical protein